MLFTLLQSICLALEARHIPYMLSGSIALNIYAVSRMTRDIDIVIRLDENHLEIFLDIFKNDTYYSREAIQQAVQNKTMFNIIDQKSGYKIDFVLLKNHPFRQTEFQRKQLSHAWGFPVWVVTLEDLILSKLLWIQDLYSDRQAEDVKNLLACESVDRVYVAQWSEVLNLNTFGLLSDE